MAHSNSLRLCNARALARLSVALAALAGATQASAGLIYTSTTNTTYAYGYAQQSTSVDGGGDINSIQTGPSDPGHIGRIGIDTVSTAQEDSFYFLLNSYCVGLCAISASSETTISLFNESDTETLTGLRFDSQITPGHLARSATDPVSYASFYFEVSQTPLGGSSEQLYWALGVADKNGVSLFTFDGSTFNGFDVETVGNAVYADWGATNLFLNLAPIGPKQTLVLSYKTSLSLDAGTNEIGPCFDLGQCAGAQVAFGDPRRSGNPSLTAGRSFLGPGGPPPPALESIIGREYDAFGVPAAINKVGDPTPPDPDVPLPPIYASVLPLSMGSPGPVPEPSTWAMMAAAFGLVGAVLRRRAPRRTRAA